MSGLHTIDIEAEEPQSASAGRHGRAGAPLLGRPVQEYHGPWSARWRGGLRRLAVSPARRCRTGEDGPRARSETLSVAAGEEGPGGARRRCGARIRGGPGRAGGGGSGGGGGSTKGPGGRRWRNQSGGTPMYDSAAQHICGCQPAAPAVRAQRQYARGGTEPRAPYLRPALGLGGRQPCRHFFFFEGHVLQNN